MKSIKQVAIGAVLLALGMVVAAGLLSRLFVRVRTEQAITVKGYAEQDVVSDIGVCRCTCRARAGNLQDVATALEKARLAVLERGAAMGLPESSWRMEPMYVQRVARRDAQGKETNEIEYYDASQLLQVTSGNVALIEEVPAALMELVKGGWDITVYSPEFTVSDLGDIKLELLTKATEDGRRRAEMLAQHSGGRVGSLVSAQQGVFQITKRHSTQVSDYGVYDTETIEKCVKAIVRLQYAIEGRKP